MGNLGNFTDYRVSYEEGASIYSRSTQITMMACEVKSLDFSAPWRESDSVLLVENKRLHVHRLVLSLHSPVFDKMFNSDFKEKNSKEIELPGKYYEEIKEMLQVLYDRRKEINERNVDFLLDLSEEYQLSQVQNACLNFIQQADKSGVKSIKYIPLLHRLGMKDLEESCLENLKSISFEEILQNEDFQNSNDETKFMIALEKGKHVEGALSSYTKTMDSLVKQLYACLHKSYIQQLTDKGYEESLLAYCHKSQHHKHNKPGYKFDVTCYSCRRRVCVMKEFNVKVKDVAHLMESLVDDKSFDVM